MAEPTRATTPPQAQRPQAVDITPEQVRRMEESRLKAKALRLQQAGTSRPDQSSRPGYPVANAAGQKRPFSAVSTTAPPTHRDARNAPPTSGGDNGLASMQQDTDIRAARKFQKYVEYDFSKMTDTK
ncbi:DNA repair protein rad14, partial [Teratosphaeriaceae sp. CCFEE 6253]